jgi:hypothetical protein
MNSLSSRASNLLIANLPHAERKLTLNNWAPVDFILGSLLCSPGEPYEYLYFPLTGLYY